jgi:hypothetical protein
MLGFDSYRYENRPASRQNTAFSHRFPPKTLNHTAASRNLGKKTPVFRPRR